MSQAETPRQTVATSVPITPWSAESDADQLMDDLFADIDQILQGGSQLPSESVANPEYVSLQPIVIPEIKMPPVLQEVEEVTAEPALEESPKLLPESSETTVVSPPQQSGILLFILGAVCVSLASTVTWLISQDRLTLPVTLNPNRQRVIQGYEASAQDIQFMEYIRRSLDVIDRKVESEAEQATVASSPGKTQDIPVVSAQPEVAVNPGTTVLERIYVPIYPSNQIPYAGVPTYTSPSPPTNVPTPLPASQVPNPPIPQVQESETPPATVEESETPTAVTPETPSELESTVPEVSSASTPEGIHTLMGLLEDGDRSIAIFDIDGVTQRIGVGEAIGSSGWMLVTVADQKAVMRRNGEVRSIYAGQKF